MSVATIPAALSPPDTALFEKNLSALCEYQPGVAEHLRAAQNPPTLSIALGRDGALTYTWTDADGRSRWLGRTTMPTIRAAALVEVFDPGDGNILLAGIGQGTEIDLLRNRLAPHQAIMVVEESTWAGACVLRLHDFAAELSTGRLLLFAGPAAWQDLERFLIEHDGFMEPLRILSWPWFEAPHVAEVSQRLTATNARLAAHRASCTTRSLETKAPPPPASTNPVVAILSTVSDPRVRRAAAVIELAATELGWKTCKFVLDSPAAVHPFGVRRSLMETGPTHCLLLDVTPAMLPYTLPDIPAFVLCTHADPLSEQWLAPLAAPPLPGERAGVRAVPLSPWERAGVRAPLLGVVNEEQKNQAARYGIPESRIFLVPPAAQSGLARSGQRPPEDAARLLVVADRIDTSPEAAGLHLASHKRLWNAAAAMVADRCDRYDDDQAGEILSAAERHIKIKLASEEVRAGLVDRIHRRLGPAIVRQEYLKSLHDQGRSFDLCGKGWEADPTFAAHHAGPWPSPREVSEWLARYETMIVFDPPRQPFEPFLDGLAVGMRCLYREVSKQPAVLPLALSGLNLPACAYASRKDLVQRLRRAEADSEILSPVMNDPHTWSHRLQGIVEFFGGS